MFVVTAFKYTITDQPQPSDACVKWVPSLLDNSLDRLDIFEFLQHVEDGLKDHYDIKVSWRGAHMAHLERVRSR